MRLDLAAFENTLPIKVAHVSILVYLDRRSIIDHEKINTHQRPFRIFKTGDRSNSDETTFYAPVNKNLDLPPPLKRSPRFTFGIIF